MILRFSQKLAKKIKEFPDECLPDDPNPFADWSADLFYVHRDQYIIFTNSKSLYSIIMHGAGVTNFNRFMEDATFMLRELLTIDRASFLYERHVIPVMNKISISKRGNRHVIGSMNDMIKCSYYYLEDGMISPFDASVKINDMPMSMLKYGHPREAFLSMNI